MAFDNLTLICFIYFFLQKTKFLSKISESWILAYGEEIDLHFESCVLCGKNHPDIIASEILVYIYFIIFIMWIDSRRF